LKTPEIAVFGRLAAAAQKGLAAAAQKRFAGFMPPP
jgi:hypothetical protein